MLTLQKTELAFVIINWVMWVFGMCGSWYCYFAINTSVGVLVISILYTMGMLMHLVVGVLVLLDFLSDRDDIWDYQGQNN